MVRLMLVLAPVMCILSGVGVSSLLTTYCKQMDAVQHDKKAKRHESNYFKKNEVCKFPCAPFLIFSLLCRSILLAGIDTVKSTFFLF